MKGRRGATLDLRAETSTVVPLAALIILALLLSVLFVVRQAVSSVVQERILLAEEQADTWLQGQHEDLGLRQRLQKPAGSLRVLLLDAEGIVLRASDGQTGWSARSQLLQELRATGSAGASVLLSRGEQVGGDDLAESHARIVTLRRLHGRPTASWLRIDWPARGLIDARRTLRRATWASTASGMSLLLVLMIYWRRRLRLLQGLIDRLRRLEGPMSNAAIGDRVDRPLEEDMAPLAPAAEVSQLLATFDQMVDRLRPESVNSWHDALGEAEDLSTGMLLLDSAGHTLALNDVGADWLGVALPLSVGGPVDELLAHQTDLLGIVQDALAKGEAVQRREVVLTAGSAVLGQGNAGVSSGDGPTDGAGAEDPFRVVGLTFAPLRREGQVTGWLGLFADITGVQEARRSEQLSHSLGQLAEMSAGLAHELRNGMSSLKGFTELLARSALGPEQREDLAEMRREVDSMYRIAEDFLSFARPGTARLERLDLAQVIRDAAGDPALAELRLNWSDGLERCDPSVRREGEGGVRGPVEVDGDRSLLERLFRNLLANGFQSQQRSGVDTPIEIAINATPEEVQVVLRDGGEGLPSDLQADELFVPFVHGAGGDTGLGLALARRIVDLHGGGIELRPRRDGVRGAEALVTLRARSLR